MLEVITRGTASRVCRWLVLVLVAVQGCSVLPTKPDSAAFLSKAGWKVGDVVHLRTGRRISFEEMIGDLETVPVIYVGETHVSRADHALQLKVARALWERHPKLAIGMEMVPRVLQPVLDRWVKGELSEKALLEQLSWEESWGYDFSLYRPLFLFARARRLPMVALNAPGTVVKKVARKGLAGLSDEERSQLADRIEGDDPRHRAFVKEEFLRHGHGNFPNFQRFYEAQLAWEETMAETLARWLRAHPGFQVLVVAGKGHVNQRFGIPERTRRRVEHRYAVIVSMPIHEKGFEVSPAVGDYLVVTPKERPFPGHGRRIGIVLDPKRGGPGLYVVSVLPGSRADRAGLRAADRIVAVDGKAVQDMGDLHEAVRAEARRLTFTVDRNGKRLEVVIDLKR
ncbi:Uncharacterized iron-regulated protein [Desulfacinum hydrothermale DSM 13146]|uniref:Uncharacterized iron-regulated protein n=1 Tax=Desulfacinum hydrothermale DSM 13146 TaxID=1121390 RepID=A0A1W1XFP6_9BACT|nr:ChaN family lipoprotein [Desulfacinum hydrothermale]SMC22783.1 Uncharacterized iron-regulated protein [Desulfacinum hydrothermale DSM 13146]